MKYRPWLCMYAFPNMFYQGRHDVYQGLASLV